MRPNRCVPIGLTAAPQYINTGELSKVTSVSEVISEAKYLGLIELCGMLLPMPQSCQVGNFLRNITQKCLHVLDC